MKKSKIFTLLFCGTILFVNAQQDNLIIGQNNINKPTNVVPPTPQAGEITRYGNQPLNEYKGMAQINIPIAEIKEKNLFNNIELKYTKLGVRVNDLANNVGVSWLLDAGGVITRTINDLPDEMQLPSDRLLFNTSSEIDHVVNIPDGSTNSSLLKSYFTDESYDNELDIFSISVNGLSGKFYLDKNLSPILITDSHQFKIETIGDFKVTHQFLLTTNDGIKYYFGGELAIEKTWIRQAPLYSGFTSFYLTKITNIENDEITFEYQNIGGKSFLNSTIEKKVIRTIDLMGTVCDALGGSPIQSYVKENNILRIQNAKVLVKIKTKEKTINFNYNNSSSLYYNKISSIDILNNFSNKKYQQINFEYLDQYSQSNPSFLERFYLTKIKKYNYQGNDLVFDNEYSFSYDDPLSLPDKDSYSVDVFGYFNNKANSTYIPDLRLLGNSQFSYGVTDGFNYADRTCDFNFAKKGTLTSIIYPTKGTTFFEYEAMPQKFTLLEYKYGEVRNTTFDTLLQEDISTLKGSDIIDNNLNIELSIFQTDIISMNTFLEVNFKIIDEATGIILLNEKITLPKTTQEDIDNGYRGKNTTLNFITDPSKKYIIKLSLVPKANVNFTGTFQMAYKNGYGKQNISGLRLKKTYDVDENNNISNIKRIYYSLFRDVNNINVLPSNYYTGSYITSEHTIASCSGGEVLEPKSSYYEIESSEPTNSVSEGETFSYPSYPTVTISYGGDYFEKGGEQKKFVNGYYDGLSILRTPFTPVLGDGGGGFTNFFGDAGYFGSLISSSITSLDKSLSYDDFNGKLLETKLFSKSSSGQLFLKRKTSNNYDLKTLRTIYDLRGKQVYGLYTSNLNLPLYSIISNFSCVSLPKNSYYSIPINTKNTEYYDNVPVDVDDDSSYKKLTTTTEYFYNSLSHYQLSSQKTTFPNASINETSYSYAHEKGNQLMINKNMIGIPLETISTQTIGSNTKTLSKAETLYPLTQSEADTKTSGLVMPISVLSYDIQNNTPSTEVTYNKYDSKGNLQQYTTKDGTPISIIWGYNNTQPIAKIEGAIYNQLSNLISGIVTASDTDGQLGTEASEQALITALNSFRNNTALSLYQTSTYTYDPLIGVKSITPPSGIREVYIYDTANRLKEIKQEMKNANGSLEYKILKEFKYNYKN